MTTPILQIDPARGEAGNSTQSTADRVVAWAHPINRFVWRARLAATCVFLTGLMFIQSPGEIAADTKLDLTQNPWGLMGRALHMWDPASFSGTLQNQAYGYLWPMGPFFWLGDTIGLPAWAIQRLWWSLLLTIAFLGMVRLIRVLDMGSPMVRYVAGLTYALSPMLLSKIGPISSEVLPIALAPWVLIPLVCASRGGSVRRWAALSGVAVLGIGGVNAVATIAVLPLGLIWILTREKTRRTWTLLGWWSVSVALACLWWAIPLVLLGKYSPPFLDWIESASITTIVSDPFSVIRGTSDWIASLSTGTGPVWWMGWLFVTNGFLIVATAIIAGLGLAGIALRPKHQSFLALSALFGFTVLAIGHESVISGLGAGQIRDLLDGPLAPLRNLHKFDPVLRVALTLGLAWLLIQTLATVRRRGTRGQNARSWLIKFGPLTATVLSLVITVGALGMGPITKNRSYIEVPPYWQQAATWLGDQEQSGKALVVPGASFAEFLWGRTQDEPFQVLGDVSWDVRDAVPLGNAGHTRLLDAIAASIENGAGSRGLTNVLERSGFEWLVIRNDVSAQAVGNFTNERIHATLAQTPGISQTATFGPEVADLAPGGYRANYGVSASLPAVEVYRVGDAVDWAPAVLRDASKPLVLSGGPEALVTTSEAGVVTDGAVVFNGNAGADLLPGLQVATDTLRRHDVNFGSPRNNAGNTLAADEAYKMDRRNHDYFDRGQSALTVAELIGAKSVTASSSAAWADTLVPRDSSAQPFAALDGDPDTAWLTGNLGSPVGQWWRVTFDGPTPVTTVRIAFARSANLVQPQSIDVATNNVIAQVDVANKDFVDVKLADPNAEFLKITLTGVAAGSGRSQFGIREVTIPGVAVSRPLRIQSPTPAGAAVLAQATGALGECIELGGRRRCAAEIGRSGEEQAGIDRWVWLTAGRYNFSLGVVPRPGAAVDNLLVPPASVIATASSQDMSDPGSRGQAASDDDEKTTWVASRVDKRPTLTLTLPEPRVITGIRVVVPPDVAVSSPFRVRVRANGRSTDGYLDNSGYLAISPVKTNRLSVQVLESGTVRSLTDGVTTVMPVGITELQLIGAKDLQHGLPRTAKVRFSCGFGPVVTVDGSPTQTGGELTVGDLITGNPATMASCGDHRVRGLAAGWHRVTAKATASLTVDYVSVLPATGIPTPTAATSPTVDSWDSAARSVTFTAAEHERTLETFESFNSGWQASIDGTTLEAIQVDGWRQGWIVPVHVGGTAELSYGPDSIYRLGLIAGLLGVVALIGLAVRRGSARPCESVRPAQLRLTVICASLIASLLVVGLWGAAMVGAVVVFASLLKSRAKRAILSGALVVLAGLIELYSRWPDSRSESGWVTAAQGLLVVAAVVVSCTAGLEPPVALRRARQRDSNDGPCE